MNQFNQSSALNKFKTTALLIVSAASVGRQATGTDQLSTWPDGGFTRRFAGLVVDDRTNHRLQNFTLDGQHIGFVADEMHAPCHFHNRGDVMVVPDSNRASRSLTKNNIRIGHLGQGLGFQGLRTLTRNHFTLG